MRQKIMTMTKEIENHYRDNNKKNKDYDLWKKELLEKLQELNNVTNSINSFSS